MKLLLLLIQLSYLALSIECMNLAFLFTQWKHGKCPREGDIDSENVCIRTCINDYSCDKDQLCCPTQCGDGYVCVEKDSNQLIGKKPGFCPRQKGEFNLDRVYCESDFSCRGAQKCCSTVKGTVCMNPLFHRLPRVCPDFADVYQSPCEIGFMKCKNNADCERDETCCQYQCGGLCMRSK